MFGNGILIGFVTPLAGVWIEIQFLVEKLHSRLVTPLAGVWIEIIEMECSRTPELVTPLAGVWIEIILRLNVLELLASHSPCGSVD